MSEGQYLRSLATAFIFHTCNNKKTVAINILFQAG